MSGPHPSVAAIRRAVRILLDEPEGARCAASGLAVACSGGADSLALTAATAFVARQRGLSVRAVIIDHGLQEASAEIAARAADVVGTLGASAEVVRVDVTGPGGTEAAARRVRYQALHATGAGLILLGHTLDDQAETVLLGLGRGSGPNSIRGMRPLDPPWGRPLLGLRRATTVAACAALDLPVWQDPHNTDRSFTRVRLRLEALPLLEDILNGGVAPALARTAARLAEDHDALETLADELVTRARTGGTLLVSALTAPPAIRRRALRSWLISEGVRGLTEQHLRGVDELVSAWRGQRGVALPGGGRALRRGGLLTVEPADVAFAGAAGHPTRTASSGSTSEGKAGVSGRDRLRGGVRAGDPGEDR